MKENEVKRGQHVLISGLYETSHKGRVTHFDGDPLNNGVYRNNGSGEIWVEYDNDDEWAGQGEWIYPQYLSPIEENREEEKWVLYKYPGKI